MFDLHRKITDRTKKTTAIILAATTIAGTLGITSIPAAQAADTSQAAVKLGWGSVTSGDEFNYTGSPDATKWRSYNSAGHAGKGIRTPSALSVANGALTISGDSQGTTGGMSSRFGKQQYGRWETRMRMSANEPQYHAVSILWPDNRDEAYTNRCWEIDYAEHNTGNPNLISFFNHEGCTKGVQSYAKKAIDVRQWHNYAVEWTPTSLKGYIDGQLWYSNTNPQNIPNVSMHQTLQLDWFPSGAATAPATMNVDWVRVYNVGSGTAPASNPTLKSTKEIVSVDSSGVLWNYHELKTTRTRIGTGWNIMDTVHVTDWNGDGITDIVAKGKDGVLYLYKGLAAGGFSRSVIGSGGWQNYDVDIAKWKKTDSKPSIIAKNRSTGELFTYPNPNGGTPGSRVKIGAGWKPLSLNLLDFDKDGSMDVIAKTSTGSMLLYRTNGSGSFINESRKTIGGGWNVFNSITTVRNFQGSATDGLLGRNSSGQLFYYRTGTSSWAARTTVGNGWSSYSISNN